MAKSATKPAKAAKTTAKPQKPAKAPVTAKAKPARAPTPKAEAVPAKPSMPAPSATNAKQRASEAAEIRAATPKATPPSKLATVATILAPDPVAVALLKADHVAVAALFKEFKDAGKKRRVQIAREVGNALKVHTAIEEEIFYPAIKDRIEDEMVNEAVVEHASAKDLIAQLDAMTGKEELFIAKVTVLGELIDHHVGEEEAQMFRQAKASGIDLDELGERMQARKDALMADAGFLAGGWLTGRAARPC